MPKRESRTTPRAQQQRVDTLRAIRTLVSTLHRSARGVEQGTGLTNAQLFILQQLAQGEPRSINDLAVVVMTQQSTVSLVVSRLEARGLVRRGRASADARRVEVTLTPSGRRMARAAPTPPLARLLDALHELSGPDVAALHRGITALVTAFGSGDAGDAPLFEESARGGGAPPRRRRPARVRDTSRPPARPTPPRSSPGRG